MDKGPEKINPGRRLVNSRSVFVTTIFVTVVTILGVWLLGLGTHRTLFVNSLLSVSILSVAFLLYIVSGLYRGIKLKDNVGRITNKYTFRSIPGVEGWGGGGDLLGLDGCAGELASLFMWLIVAIILSMLLWFLGNVFWMLILIFVAMLYWIFFRALRLIFRKSPVCRGNLVKSMAYGLYYTVLYNFWIYGIIMTAHFLIQNNN